jgi:hypothetical protein
MTAPAPSLKAVILDRVLALMNQAYMDTHPGWKMLIEKPKEGEQKP